MKPLQSRALKWIGLIVTILLEAVAIYNLGITHLSIIYTIILPLIYLLYYYLINTLYRERNHFR
jgi:uncharacterized membrane protein YkvI